MEHAKVLVVDDEEPIRRILCEILEREMISSDTASDGYEAIRKLEENDYDVVLLDLNMPGMSGLDVLRSICDLGKPVEVIIVTGYGSLDSAIEAVRYRAYDYVLKPFEATQITKIVKNALEKRRLMKDLERAYRYTSSLLKSSADVIISTDMSKTVVIFNPAAEKLTGYAAEEVIGRSVDMLLPEGRREEFGRLCVKVMEDGSLGNLDLPLLRKDGREVPLSGTLSLIKSDDSDPEGLLLILKDLRERDRLQQQLLQAQKMAALGQFAAGVAHELRNPLGIMNTSLYYVRTHIKDGDPKIKEHLEIIGQEIRRSQKIITSLLDFSRRPASPAKSMDLRKVVEEALERVIKDVPPSIKVRKEYKGDVKVMADMDDVRQALINVITNAVEAMEDGGELSICVEKEGERGIVRVSDTGCGIPEENMAHIYNPFFTTKRAGKGVGLGLAITYSILQRYKGTIEAESEEGKGTTFTLSLPCGG